MMSVSGFEAVSPQTPLPPLQIQPTSPSSIHFDGSVDPLSPSYVSKEDVASPILPLQLHYQPHDCSQACIPNLPRSAHYFRWHNPLKVPLLLSFQRQCAGPQAMKSRLESEWGESVDSESCDLAESGVTYQTPCGRSLHTPWEVLSFLLVTGSHSVLQMDYFSFNPKVQLDCPRPLSWRPVPMVPAERDLSRGWSLHQWNYALEKKGHGQRSFGTGRSVGLLAVFSAAGRCSKLAVTAQMAVWMLRAAPASEWPIGGSTTSTSG